MRYEIRNGPAYALAVVTLDQGEQFRAEAGAMVTMTDTIKIETRGGGSLGSILRRTLLGGESLFMNDMTATQPNSVLTLAPALPGDVVGVEIDGGRDLLVPCGSYMASTQGVNVDAQFGAGKTFFSGEGLFLLKLTGPGLTLLSSYGAVVPWTSRRASRTSWTRAISWRSTRAWAARSRRPATTGRPRCWAARAWCVA